MGWEEILDAEGADMADAYNDSLPEETYETAKVYDPEQDKKSEMDSMRRLVESYEEEKDRIEYICDFEGVPDVLVYDAYKDDIFEDVISEELLGPDISFVDMSHDQLMKAWTKFGQDINQVRCTLACAEQDIQILMNLADDEAKSVLSSYKNEIKKEYEEVSRCCDGIGKEFENMTLNDQIAKLADLVLNVYKSEEILKLIEVNIHCLMGYRGCYGAQIPKDMEDKYQEKYNAIVNKR